MNVLAGIASILAGLAVVIFHNTIRQTSDDINERSSRLFGDWWTGEYSRGGLLIIRGITILVGLILIYGGIRILLDPR